MVEPPSQSPPEPETEVSEEIGRKAERLLKAREEERPRVWFGLGMFGLVGWSVAVPTLLGVAAGLWLDARLQDRMSWTLMLLFVGAALGCLNAWYWVRRESGRK